MTKNSTIFVYVILKYPYERTVIKKLYNYIAERGRLEKI